MPGPTATARIDSPIGVIAIAATPVCLTGISILPRQRGAAGVAGHALLEEACEQLCAYFDGKLKRFDLPFASAGTAEGDRMRAAILSIPFGQTNTYGTVAARVQTSARAIGQACKANPFPILVPCHRVISSSGAEYYSGGGGPRTKAWLNDFEHDHLPSAQRTRLI